MVIEMSDNFNSDPLLASDIEKYLEVHENKDMLRILTCGSVDDGKSTLIGRLLFDNKMIFDDQLAAIEKDSQRFNTTDNQFDLALLVDGLQSEREQGITIDVAYRYFTSEQRKFIIADTPGHEQYTRNMATGASTSDLAVILIDARYGVQVQTKRHSFICSLLGIRHVIVAINKMDVVNYDQKIYQDIKKEYREFSQDLAFEDVRFVPVSALRGDNIVKESENMKWYPGSTLMKLLNTVSVKGNKNQPFRMQVQYVNRPNLNFRGYCGAITGGEIRVGDTLLTLPSGKESKVKSIVTFDGELENAYVGMSVTLTLEDEIDVSRGNIFVRPHEIPSSSNKVSADVVWMSEVALHVDREYEIKKGSHSVFGFVESITHKIDINTLKPLPATQLKLNEIGRCEFSLSEVVQFDPYEKNHSTGSFIIIDRLSNITVGAGMIRSSIETNEELHKFNHSEFEVEFNQLVRKHFPHWGAKKIG
jgi:sulfate adenylyltransferase subunit 1